jgi:hypothetical protein
MCDFKNYVIKIMSVQHNNVCNCIYIRTNITTCSMTQSLFTVLLFFDFMSSFFQNSAVLLIGQLQWPILAEEEIT